MRLYYENMSRTLMTKDGILRSASEIADILGKNRLLLRGLTNVRAPRSGQTAQEYQGFTKGGGCKKGSVGRTH